VVSGKQFVPLGQSALPVTFRDVSNYHTEMLSFEVVDFFGPYHITLGKTCYSKFMAIPSYAYLKPKIPEPTSFITMSQDLAGIGR
jgi:hypothetical protein